MADDEFWVVMVLILNLFLWANTSRDIHADQIEAAACHQRRLLEKMMTKDEWIAQCAARYISSAELSPEDANAAALACWDALEVQDGDEIPVEPEEAADDDMSYWTDDGEE